MTAFADMKEMAGIIIDTTAACVGAGLELAGEIIEPESRYGEIHSRIHDRFDIPRPTLRARTADAFRAGGQALINFADRDEQPEHQEAA